jgi:hypothetical protein
MAVDRWQKIFRQIVMAEALARFGSGYFNN